MPIINNLTIGHGALIALALAVFLVLGLISFSARAGEPYISSEEALARAKKDELIIVDVRAPEEWKETGIGLHAHAISMHRPGFLEKVLEAVGGDKTKPIAVICTSGSRSNKMQGVLKKAGFSNVYDISEGMSGRFFTRGWIGKQLPVRAYR